MFVPLRDNLRVNILQDDVKKTVGTDAKHLKEKMAHIAREREAVDCSGQQSLISSSP